MHRIFRVYPHNNKGTLVNKPRRYIAVFKNLQSGEKKLGKSSPMAAMEIGINIPPPANTTFIFIVPAIDLGIPSKTDAVFEKTLEIINRHLDNFRFREDFDEEKIQGFVEQFQKESGLMLINETTISQEENLAQLNQKLKRETQKTASHDQTLQTRTAALETQLKQSQRTLASTREAEEKLQRSVARLEGELQREKQKTSSSNNQTLQTQITELKTQLHIAKLALVSTREAEEKLQRSVARLEGELDREKQKTSSSHLHTLHARIAELETKSKGLDELRESLRKSEENRDVLKKQTDELNRKASAAEMQLTTTQKEAQEQNSELQHQLNEQTITASTLQRELTDTQVRVAELESKSNELDEFRENIKKTEELTALRAQLEETEQTRATQAEVLKNQTEAHQRHLDRIKSEKETVQKSLATSLSEIERLNKLVNNYQTNIDEEKAGLIRSIWEIKTEKINAVNALQEELTHIQATQIQLTEKNTALTQALQDKTDTLTNVTAQLTALRTQAEELTVLRVKLKEIEQARDTAVAQLTTQTVHHPQQLQEKNNEIQELHAFVDTLTKQNNELLTIISTAPTTVEEVTDNRDPIQPELTHDTSEAPPLKASEIQQIIDANKLYKIEISHLKGELDRLTQDIDSLGNLPLATTSTYLDPTIGEMEFDFTEIEQEAELKLLRQQMEGFKSLHHQEKENSRRLRKEKDGLIHSVATTETQLAKTKQALDELREQLEKNVTAHDTDAQALKMQLEKHIFSSEEKISELESQKKATEEKLAASTKNLETLNERSEEANRKAVRYQQTIHALQQQVDQLLESQKQLIALQKKVDEPSLQVAEVGEKADVYQVPSSGIIKTNLKTGAANMGEPIAHDHSTSPVSFSPATKETGPKPTTPNTDSDSGHGSPTPSITEESPTLSLKEQCRQFIVDIVKQKIVDFNITADHEPLIAADLAHLDERSILEPIFLDTPLDQFVKDNLTNDTDEIKRKLSTTFKSDIEASIELEILALQDNKTKKIKAIHDLLTPEAVIEKLHRVAQDAFQKEFSDSENATAIPAYVPEALKETLNALLVADNHLDTLKDQLQTQLKNDSLSTLNTLETSKLIDTLINSSIQGQATLSASAEEIAKHHATYCRASVIASEIFKEKIENSDAFKTRLNNLGLSSQALIDDPSHKTLRAELEKHILYQLNAAKEANQVINAEKITAIKAAIPADLIAQIDPALATTLTQLEAKQTPAEAIESCLSKINSNVVMEKLQKEAREALDKKLSDVGGYQADETRLTELNQHLQMLIQDHLETAKENLRTHLKNQPLERIQRLNNDDSVIDALINTEFDQSETNKTLQAKAVNKAENLAEELIAHYKNKTPADLEKVYSDKLSSINQFYISFAKAKEILTSRGLMLWIDKESSRLTQIEQAIASGKLSTEQAILQQKVDLNPSNLTKKEIASYKKSIESIEAITKKHGNIKKLLEVLSGAKKALQKHIDINNNNQDQALVNISMPTRQHTVFDSSDDKALRKARNDANTTTAKEGHGLTYTNNSTYQTKSFINAQTLFLSANIKNKPTSKKNHVISIKICREDARSRLYIDAIDGDVDYSNGFFSRKTPIERYSNTAKSIKFITQAMLENAQGIGNTPEEKGTGILIINTHRPEWKNIYTELMVQRYLHPEQPFPFIQFEGPALDFLIKDKKREQFEAKVEELVARRIKNLGVPESNLTDPLGIDSNNSRAALRCSG